MFSSSTQIKHWTFPSEAELHRLREEANITFIKQYNQHEEKPLSFFLTPSEERMLCQHYEFALKEFCTRFKPAMPKNVIGTAMAYFKRFYLHNSVMDYHPKEIMLTCVYLACKVEEFNVSIMQFVSNIKGDPEQLADIILSFELLLMQQLRYNLTIHNPWRPLEGRFIDIKTKCAWLDDAERLRKGSDDFLDRSLNTDTGLIFAPSQLALAAILSSASKQNINLDSYVTETLIGPDNKEQIQQAIECIKRIKYMVKNNPSLKREAVRSVEKKLSLCRNQANNPRSDIYKQRMYEMLQEEEGYQDIQNTTYATKQRQEEKELLGV